MSFSNRTLTCADDHTERPENTADAVTVVKSIVSHCNDGFYQQRSQSLPLVAEQLRTPNSKYGNYQHGSQSLLLVVEPLRKPNSVHLDNAVASEAVGMQLSAIQSELVHNARSWSSNCPVDTPEEIVPNLNIAGLFAKSSGQTECHECG